LVSDISLMKWQRYASSLYKPLLKMLNDIVLNSIIVTIETLTYRKSIADKLISSSHGYRLRAKI